MQFLAKYDYVYKSWLRRRRRRRCHPRRHLVQSSYGSSTLGSLLLLLHVPVSFQVNPEQSKYVSYVRTNVLERSWFCFHLSVKKEEEKKKKKKVMEHSFFSMHHILIDKMEVVEEERMDLLRYT